MDLKKYKIVYETDKETGQISTSIPKLNHISSFGNTYEEATKMLKGATECYWEKARIIKKHQILKPKTIIEGAYLKVLIPSFIN
ncbi:MAG: hypothetical protein WCX79_04610 [Candidatus Paceibacterota bacterium]|jgi:predicted RNase H-like HicB family nuclease